MNDAQKKTSKKVVAWILGLGGAAAAGFAQGAAIDKVLTEQLVESLTKGDLPNFIALVSMAFLIWFEVRGMKKAMKQMNGAITSGFTAGEKRFENIESDVSTFKKEVEHRLTLLEKPNLGGLT